MKPSSESTKTPAASASLHPSVFHFFPVASFVIWERRSLTVHLEDAGMFDVSCDDGDEGPTHAGRYATFDEALAVQRGLNAVWRACPSSTSAEVLAFAAKRITPAVDELLTLALPYVEEGEQFNKPHAPKLSAQIRAVITTL